MPDPTVCAVMLANGRPEMVERSVRAFRAQTYEPRWLLIWDTTSPTWLDEVPGCDLIHETHLYSPKDTSRTIGALRNLANMRTLPLSVGADIIVHWDSDDWSHPNRIAEQVALLQASGAECVGYREMLFWRTREKVREDYDGAIELMRRIQDYPEGFNPDAGQAWLYSNPLDRNILGTSLCYWRKTWEAHPFPDTSQGEDMKWLLGLRNVAGVTSFGHRAEDDPVEGYVYYTEPCMIASIHGRNTCARIEPQATEWRRVPEWDEHVRRIMEG